MGEPSDDDIDPRAPFTRRAFLAGAGAAAATVAIPATASAATGSDPIYRIHPAIGVARVGNAPSSEYFIGPELPGHAPLGEAPGTPVPPYKTNGQVKPQAARFRIFEYAMVNGALAAVREVTLATAGVVGIRWRAHLANKKAAFHRFAGGAGENGTAPASYRNATVTDRRSLEIDFGPREIAGASHAPVELRLGTSGDPASENAPRKPDGTPVIDYLGELRTDAAGRLIVIGGKGRAAYDTLDQPPTPSYANNDHWYDDVSDGPVTAVVTISGPGGPRDIAVDAGAWVLCAPPDFAPGIPGSVTAYDLLFDLAVRQIAIPPDAALYKDGGELAELRVLQEQFAAGAITFRPSFVDHIQPMLVAAYNLWWVDALVTAKHNTLISSALADPGPASASKRQRVFGYLRAPAGYPGASGTMPKQLGDAPYDSQAPDAVQHLALTRVQYELMRQWADGNFSTTGSGPPAAITAHGLDRAALENASGGAFYPGIEFSWQMRNADLFLEPFRLDLSAPSQYPGDTGPIGPGHFSRQMALPWHTDFNDCDNEGSYAWWPAQRPTDVLPTASATKRVTWARATNRFAGGNRDSNHEDMIANWSKFGFVLESGDLFVEAERNPQIP